MVQLYSPKPDMIPVKTGDKKVRTLSRTDQTHSSEKSKFQESLEKEKSPGKKNVSDKSAEQSEVSSESKSVHKKIVVKKHLGHENLKDQKILMTEIQGLLGGDAKAESGKNHKSETVVPLKRSIHRKKSTSLEASLVQSAAENLKNQPGGTVKAEQGESLQEAVTDKMESVSAASEDTPVKELVLAAENTEALNGGVSENLISNRADRQNLTGRKKSSAGRTVRDVSSSDYPKITVEDRRTVKTESPRSVFAPAEKQENEDLTLEMAPQDDLTGVTVQGEAKDSTTQFVLHSSEEQKGSLLLDKQLQEGGTKEIAKNIRFVLKDQNQGEIKLILKPEALGKVRIQLNLQENNIVGKIFVENNSVKQVFLNNLSELSKALEDSGFQTASLDVSVGGGETGRQNQHRDEPPVYFQRDLSEVEEHIPHIFEESPSLSQIDLVI